MRKTILMVSTILISTLTFATGFTKGSPQLNAVASAWKSQGSTDIQRQNITNHHDIIMGYGGQDVTGKSDVPVLAIA